jgi:histidinol phosphatase-like enzyme
MRADSDPPSGRVVFLDRDGVINVHRADHVECWEELECLPGAVGAIFRLSQAGLEVFVVTRTRQS